MTGAGTADFSQLRFDQIKHFGNRPRRVLALAPDQLTVSRPEIPFIDDPDGKWREGSSGSGNADTPPRMKLVLGWYYLRIMSTGRQLAENRHAAGRLPDDS